MEFLSKLKKLIGSLDVKIGDIKFLNFNINITKIDQPTISSIYDKDNNILHIDTRKLSQQQVNELRVIANESIDQGSYILETGVKELLDGFYAFNKSSDYSGSLKTLEPIIPSADYGALELAYFIKSRLDKRDGINVGDLKSQIAFKYGKRGNHITNLCTAGYFENLLIPIHNQAPGIFEEYYNLIVEEEALTFFIHGQLTDSEIVSTIESKISRASAYGLPVIYIHSRGKKNNATTKRAIKRYEKAHGELDKSFKEIQELEISSCVLRLRANKAN